VKDHNKDTAIRALANEAADAYNRGEPEAVSRALMQVTDRYLHDPDFDASDTDIMDNMILMHEGLGDFARVLEVIRRRAKLTGEASFKFGLRYYRALSASREIAVLDDFAPHMIAAHKGRCVLIACIQKTGSTFLQSALLMVSGAAGPKLGLSYANEENIMHPETVLALAQENVVAQEHCRATPQNLAIAQGFGMEVIVLVRDIFDSLVSLRDMLAGDTHGSVAALFQDHMKDMDEETQLDAVITRWAHWQLDFYTSWVRAQRNGLIKCQFWGYEDMMYDKVAAVQEICRQVGIEATPDHIRSCVETVDGNKNLSRKNVGVSGRGRKLMNERQINDIQAMTRFYPDIDFGPLGL
jgi:hypothetical protein